MDEIVNSERSWLAQLDSHPGFDILKTIFREELRAVEASLETTHQNEQMLTLVQYWKVVKRFIQLMDAPAEAREELDRLKEEENGLYNPYRDPLAPPVPQAFRHRPIVELTEPKFNEG